MKIADSLRHECMPEMVYSLCKMCQTCIERKDLQRVITLGDNSKSSQDQFNNVLTFAIECGFIGEEDGVLLSKFEGGQLETFKSFRYAIFSEVLKNRNTKFIKMAEWYLQKSTTEIFSLDTASDLAARVNDEIALGIDKFFALGFRFWMVALGLAAQQNYRKSAVVYACHDILEQVIVESSLEKNKPILAGTFMEYIVDKGAIFGVCVSNNKINMGLSMALRVLRDSNIIELNYVNDSSDIWHMEESNFDVNNLNKFTEVVIRR